MITVFTPTYNRADKLNRVYESLIKQKNYSFEWLIVDDGSSDDTEGVIKSFSNSPFPIRYYKKGNGGKHTAYNIALELAEGSYFLCVDSDDWLSDEAIQILNKELEICSTPLILAYKTDEKGNMLSDYFPHQISHIGLLDLSNRYNCSGEFSIILKTEFARKYPFPIFEGERFLTEAVIYDRMAQDEEASLIPHVITICEYQSDGLTSNLNRIMKSNPAGYCLYFMQRIDLAGSWKKRVVTAGKYHCFCVFSKDKKSDYCGNYRMMVALTRPIGFLFWVYYKVWRRF